tara:strand:- start:303 stop:434 length:132 start_codon:yes stop_codon:yes gene_type:complete
MIKLDKLNFFLVNKNITTDATTTESLIKTSDSANSPAEKIGQY